MHKAWRTVVVVVMVWAALIVQPASATRQQDVSCREFVLDDETITVLSGCRQDERGTWFYPTGPRDSRLPDMSPLEDPAGMRAALRVQLHELEAAMPDWLADELNSMHSDRALPYEDGGLTRGIVSNKRHNVAVIVDEYEEVLIWFVQNPEHQLLEQYAIWLFDRRQTAFPAPSCLDAPPPICYARRAPLRVDTAPWPWEMADELTMDDYIRAIGGW